jgi:hypothetical protein
VLVSVSLLAVALLGFLLVAAVAGVAAVGLALVLAGGAVAVVIRTAREWLSRQRG